MKNIVTILVTVGWLDVEWKYSVGGILLFFSLMSLFELIDHQVRRLKKCTILLYHCDVDSCPSRYL